MEGAKGKKALFFQRAEGPEKDKDIISTQNDTVSLGSSTIVIFVVGKGIYKDLDIAFHIYNNQLHHTERRVYLQPPFPGNLSCA